MVELKSLTEDAAFLNSLSMPWTGFEFVGFCCQYVCIYENFIIYL